MLVSDSVDQFGQRHLIVQTLNDRFQKLPFLVERDPMKRRQRALRTQGFHSE